MPSAARAMPRASSVRGTPCLSMAAPPTKAVEVSKRTFPFLLKKPMRRSTSAITSGPMPSPGSSKSECALIGLLARTAGPRIASSPGRGGQVFQDPAGRQEPSNSSAKEWHVHCQGEAIDHQQHAQKAEGTAQPQQRPVADDEVHGCQHDADLQQRLAPVEIRILAQRHIALDFQGLGLCE